MINFNDNIVSANIGLKTDGVTLSGDGTSDNPIGVVGNTLHRYEKCLFSASGTNPQINDIVLSEPLSGYDQVMFKMNWQNKDNSINGTMWQTSQISNKYIIEYHLSNRDYFGIREVYFNLPSTGTQCSLMSGVNMSTPIWTTATWSYTNNTETNIINEIWGVKFA